MTSTELNRFINAGYSIIPCGNNKRPVIDAWEEFQYRLPDKDEYGDMPFLHSPAVGLICGNVSGGVECIDVDVKNDPTGTIWQRYHDEIINRGLKHVLDKCLIQQTVSGGIHIIYKCPNPGRSTKLATVEKETLIETKGNGGYVIIEPSPRYKVIQGDKYHIEELSQVERDGLLDAARVFDDTPIRSIPRQYKSAPKAKHDTINSIIQQLEEHNINVTANYLDWVKLGLGIAQTFGEEGRKYFHQVSQLDSRYDIAECNYKYDDFLKDRLRRGPMATVRSFYAIAKDYGVDIRDPEDGDEIESFVKRQAFRYNIILRRVEDHEGNQLDDLRLNKLWVDCRKECGKVGRALLEAYVFNEDNIEKYNPITEYFDQLQHRHYEGNPLGDFVNHLDLEKPEWKPLIEKWLMSVVASAYGDPSELILVLIGDQHNGKTWFFQTLLPNTLKDFYTVDKLDQGKDSDILMTQKLIILDDEFSGKSKKDANHLKAMASKNVFSVRFPYGRTTVDLPRLAVLCGTSNLFDVINDTTGNRRILPVVLKSRDYAISDQIDREDLWAQLVQSYFAAESRDAWTATTEEVKYVKENSEEHQKTNPERELISKYWEPCRETDPGVEFMTASDITNALNEKMPGVRIFPQRVGQELTTLGFTRISKRLDSLSPPRYVYALRERQMSVKGEEIEDPLPF